MSLDLGPFRLVKPIGRGAMAEVWRAEHRAQGVPVAIKVVTAPVAQRQKFRAWFAHELRAVARLDHPGVVRIYDHGEITPDVAAYTRRLPRHAPYLAMEFLDGGPLTARAGRMPWPTLRATLLGLLDALGHAHARGIIHRDLKPDNVLMAERGPVLTDFGVAFTAERAADDRGEAFAGTPNYMSPEQVTGDLRALGPWSDLYAIGCLACTLVRGKPPFSGRGTTAVARAQLLAPPPELEPGLPCPPGFEGWMHRLLAKRPRERFQFAADAAVALMALPDEAPSPPQPEVDEAILALADDTVVAAPVFLSAPAEIWSAGPDARGRPPFPETWQRPIAPPTPAPLLGVGRTVFGLRAPSLHGREGERDVLWRALEAVVRGQGARAVLVDGPSGQGKSRLARWLSQRVHELGVADTVFAVHGAMGGAGTGLGPMLARVIRTEGLAPDRRRRQISRALELETDAALLDAVAAACAPADAQPAADAAVVLGSARERNAVIAQALVRLARRRPLVLRLEDVHHSDETLSFIDALLEARPDAPLMLVATGRLSAMAANDPGRAVLDRLRQHPAVEHITLGPLDDAALADSVRSRLPLSATVVDQLVTRAAGNPQFAESIMEHWLQANHLVEGPRGFELRSGAAEVLPDSVRHVWRQRLAEFVSGPEAGLVALELAAALGRAVDTEEWQAVCAEAGVDYPRLLIERLLDAGLLHEDDDGVTFAQPMLQQTVIDGAQRAGRHAEHHQSCARMLRARQTAPSRVARHLLAAAAWAEALPPLLEATDRAIERKAAPAAQRALVDRMRALRAIGLPRDSEAWVVTRIRWARLCRMQGRPDAAGRHAASAVPDAGALGDHALLARALLEQARAAAVVRGFDKGIALARASAVHASQAEDPIIEGRALLTLGGMLLATGESADARSAYEAALDRLDGNDDAALLRASVMAALADAARREADLDRAFHFASSARSMYRRAGSRWGQAHTANLLGDIARFRDEFTEAERSYREAARLYGGLDSFDALAVEGNLALTLIATDRLPEARRLIERALMQALTARIYELTQVFQACLLPCLAHDRDWLAWDDVYRAIDGLVAGRLVDPDAARCAAHAGRLAVEADDPTRARQAFELAVVQFERLGRADDAARIQREMRRLGGSEETVDEPGGAAPLSRLTAEAIDASIDMVDDLEESIEMSIDALDPAASIEVAIARIDALSPAASETPQPVEPPDDDLGAWAPDPWDPEDLDALTRGFDEIDLDDADAATLGVVVEPSTSPTREAEARPGGAPEPDEDAVTSSVPVDPTPVHDDAPHPASGVVDDEDEATGELTIEPSDDGEAPQPHASTDDAAPAPDRDNPTTPLPTGADRPDEAGALDDDADVDDQDVATLTIVVDDPSPDATLTPQPPAEPAGDPDCPDATHAGDEQPPVVEPVGDVESADATHAGHEQPPVVEPVRDVESADESADATHAGDEQPTAALADEDDEDTLAGAIFEPSVTAKLPIVSGADGAPHGPISDEDQAEHTVDAADPSGSPALEAEATLGAAAQPPPAFGDEDEEATLDVDMSPYSDGAPRGDADAVTLEDEPEQTLTTPTDQSAPSE